jgi:hypothetical protein
MDEQTIVAFFLPIFHDGWIQTLELRIGSRVLYHCADRRPLPTVEKKN